MSMDRNNADTRKTLEEKLKNPQKNIEGFTTSNYYLPASGYFTQQIEDLEDKLVSQSTTQFVFQINLIRFLILAKIVATLAFLVALGKAEIFFFIFMLTFEYFGYYGSTRLKYKCKLVFLSYLVINTLVRIASVWYYLTLIDNFTFYFQDKFMKNLLSQVNFQYIFCSLFFIGFEILQFVLSLKSAQIMASLTSNRKIELEFLVTKQNSRLFCARKSYL